MSQLSNIKSQIQSIDSISKITKAMELVSTAKLKKISKNLLDIKVYFSEVYQIFNEIIKSVNDSKYLVQKNFQENKTLWIIINSNIGLCGGYNLNVNKLVMKHIKPEDEIFAIGSKAKSYFLNHKKNVVKSMDVNINFSNEDSKEYAFSLHDDFLNKKYDSIKIAYTSFINNVNYEAKILDLLPIVKIKSDKEILKNNAAVLIEFEPSVEEILEGTIILYLNTILYSTVLESQVSEHISRRVAMENATNNANDLKDKLVLMYNRKRQDGITQEITEIVSGSDAQNKK